MQACLLIGEEDSTHPENVFTITKRYLHLYTGVMWAMSICQYSLKSLHLVFRECWDLRFEFGLVLLHVSKKSDKSHRNKLSEYLMGNYNYLNWSKTCLEEWN